MPFFSVIIPLYNKEIFIENTIKSILNQNFTDFEVIIVNDGSTDTGEEKVLQFNDSRIRYFSKENKGVSSARNYGISVSLSNYIAFIDADDYWFPDFLQEIFQNINQFPEQKVFSVAIEIETPQITIPAKYSISKKEGFRVVNYFEASMKTTLITASSAVFHKSIFKEIGAFDIELKSGEDTDFWIRIGLFYPILFSSKILVRYVYDPESLSKKVDFSKKINFSKFTLKEKNNLKLKKFLDFNRYSLAIKYKLNNDKSNFKKIFKDISLENLSLKKRILLNLPAFVLKKLIQLNLFFVRIGLSNSVFK